MSSLRNVLPATPHGGSVERLRAAASAGGGGGGRGGGSGGGGGGGGGSSSSAHGDHIQYYRRRRVSAGLALYTILFSALLFAFADFEWIAGLTPRDTTNEHWYSDKRVVIVGGGVTGLCAARRLEELGYANWELYEAAPHFGGLAQTIVDERGFSWDIGVHVMFSHFQFFDRLLDESITSRHFLYHQRKSPAFMRGNYVTYPVQDNLWQLPEEEALSILQDLNASRSALRRCPAVTGKVDFDTWLVACFGERFADAFGRPYNYKVWAHPTKMLNSKWVGERVATIDVDEIIRMFNSREEHAPWGPNSVFRYPERGTGAMWDSVSRKLPSTKLNANKRLISADFTSKELLFRAAPRGKRTARGDDAAGTDEVVTYDYLLSTIPMNQLLRLGGQQSRFERELADGFLHQTCHVVGVGLRGAPPPHLRDVHWLYFPEPEFPFYRITILSNLSPALVPQPGAQWSVLTETGESACCKRLNGSAAALVQQVVDALRAARVIPPADGGGDDAIVSRFHRRFEYGYPVPYVSRDAHVHAADRFLRSKAVFSRGRFGSWKYEVANQDHSCMLGVEAVDAMVLGKGEQTLFHASHVNNMYRRHPITPGKVFDTRAARYLPALPSWHFVVARCSGGIDWIDGLVQQLPLSVKYKFFVYETCAPLSADTVASDAARHVLRFVPPEGYRTDAEVFLHHITATFRRTPHVTFFLPLSFTAALEAVSGGVRWMRCVAEMRAHMARFPHFAHLGFRRYHAVALDDGLCGKMTRLNLTQTHHSHPSVRLRFEQDSSSSSGGGGGGGGGSGPASAHDLLVATRAASAAAEAACPPRVAGCMGAPFYVSSVALRRRTEREWRRLLTQSRRVDFVSAMELTWHMVFGQAPVLDPLQCFEDDAAEGDGAAAAAAAAAGGGAVATSDAAAAGSGEVAVDAPVRAGPKPCASLDSLMSKNSESINGVKRNVIVVTGCLGNIGLQLTRVLLAETTSSVGGKSAGPVAAATSADAATTTAAAAAASAVGISGGSDAVLVCIDHNPRPVPQDLRGALDRTLLLHRAELSDYDAVAAVLRPHAARLRGVFHLAALSTVADCERDKERCVLSNVHGTQNVVRALRELSEESLDHVKPWLVFTSSREVFGDTGDAVVDEFSTKNPANVYGNSKLIGEAIVREHTSHGFAAVITRFSNVYGSWEDRLTRVTPNFVCRAELNMSLVVVGGKQRLNLLFIDDAVRSLLLAAREVEAQRDVHGEYLDFFNIATSESVAILDLADTVIRAVGHSSSNVTFLPAELHFVDRYNTKTERAAKKLGFVAKVSLMDGLADFMLRYPYEDTGGCPKDLITSRFRR